MIKGKGGAMQALFRLILMFCCICVGAIWGMQVQNTERGNHQQETTSDQPLHVQIEAIHPDGLEVSVLGSRYYLPISQNQSTHLGTFKEVLSDTKISNLNILDTLGDASLTKENSEVEYLATANIAQHPISRTGNGIGQLLHQSSKQGLEWFASFFSVSKKND